jgi:hypothetical protein
MNKIKYSIIIGKKNYNLNLSNNYKEDSKIFRYAKTCLKKLNVDYFQELVGQSSINLDRCPFCNSISKYDIIYYVDRINNIIYFNGIKNIITDHMINYHCKNGKNKCPGSLLNPNSIKYISKAFDISEEQSRKYIIDRNNSPFYRKNHSSDEDYKNFQSRSIEWYIKKYGPEEGNKKYIKFCEKISLGNSSKKLIEKYGIEGFNEINKKKAVCNLSYFIKKYGEEIAKDKFKEYKKSIGKTKEQYIEKFGIDSWNKRRETIERKKSLENFIEIFGFDEGIKKHNDLLKSYGLNKEQYIKKYGEEKWVERYKNSNFKFYSKESSIFFNILESELIKNNIEIKNIKKEENELFLWDSEFKRIYFYDFCFDCNNKKIILEYDNSYWHPTKDSKNKNAWNNFLKNSDFTIEDKIEYDERKKLWAKYKGYDIISIYYSGKNPVRKINLWNDFINDTIIKIKDIIKC